ncbi:MAG: transposase [Candidatus Jorgensenbacteria bacterium]
MRPRLVNGEIYHIYNRGTDRRTIFMDDKDRFRFVHSLFESNNSESVPKFYGYVVRQQFSEVGLPKIIPKIDRGPRKFIVEVLAFCLMPNHFHLLVRQRTERGISKFMQKFGTGYTNYFNVKHERSGNLFQGKFKAVHISGDAQFLFIPFYIHSNPLDLKFPEWREGGVRNMKEALNYLKKYRWSSFPDYIGIKNFPSVTQRDFLSEYFGRESGYLTSYKSWLARLEEDWGERKGITIE